MVLSWFNKILWNHISFILLVFIPSLILLAWGNLKVNTPNINQSYAPLSVDAFARFGGNRRLQGVRTFHHQLLPLDI